MGTIAISALDIGALILGGIIGKVLPKVVSGGECGPDCVCSADEKSAIKAKIAEVRGLLDQLEAGL